MRKLILLLIVLFIGCSKEDQIQDTCKIDLPNPDRVCTEQYEPVCGCDNVTYSNSCVAEGIVSLWNDGECKN